MPKMHRDELAFIDFTAGVGLEDVALNRGYKTLGHAAVAIMRVKRRPSTSERFDLRDAIDRKRRELRKYV